MDIAENSSHSFLVRVWLERSAEETDAPIWRGHVTHVPSGTRRHLHNLDDIALFIAPYLDVLGVKLPFYWRVRLWQRERKVDKA